MSPAAVNMLGPCHESLAAELALIGAAALVTEAERAKNPHPGVATPVEPVGTVEHGAEAPGGPGGAIPEGNKP